MGSTLASGSISAIALGSNLGDRLTNLLMGLRSLQGHDLALEAVSSVYETPPVGYKEQPDFLNLVALATSPLPPRELLSIFHSVEGQAGRDRRVRNGPRSLDVDLVLFQDRIIRTESLRVPHPRWRERSFVVYPLAEIGPDLRDPETGWRVGEIRAYWPMEPSNIRMLIPGPEVEKALEE